ncbi:MAG TPA: nucleotide sugar dehydrogenase [Solirubrobacterales bacterium]|nr:nucleotide sugar dehydrogenase [Solirubrobacterales bacterium]
MTQSREPIGVIGVGWVGLVTATCFAELGHPVVARDILPEKVASLSSGETTIHEPGLDELLVRNAERLTFTTEMGELLEAARLIFVCVDTPPTRSGDADLSRVRAVLEELPADGEQVLIMKSTVPAGTGEAIRRDRPGLAYVSCPEFLKEGSAVADFMHPDRVVIGADRGDEEAGDAVATLYEPLGGEIVRTDVASAEMIKLASNAFLATKISFVNEIANVCEEVGADVGEVARGMGLDQRIGPSFLRAGIGYGGSCFEGRETLLVRHHGTPKLVSFEQLWELCGGDEVSDEDGVIAPESLFAWSWVPGEERPEWMFVSILTKRDYDGAMVELRTKMGRRARVTADHPVIVGDGEDGEILTTVRAEEVTESDWLPLSLGAAAGFAPRRHSVMGAIEDTIPTEEVIVRPEVREIEALEARPVAERAVIFDHPRGQAQRMGDISRSGALRLPEACRAEMDLHGATLGTARNGTYVPKELELGEEFWRVVGLYVAEGHIARDRGRDNTERRRICWSFYPTKEEHLARQVADYWEAQGVKVRVFDTATSRCAQISSRIVAAWWSDILGLGSNSYRQRVPNLLWEQPVSCKWAFLSGLWEGDGSWSLVNHGPSVSLDFGTISDELADGVARLLGELGVVCAWRRGRTAKSTKETHWLKVSGADQVERAIALVPAAQRQEVVELMALQSKRIAPSGYRRFTGSQMAWVRVVNATKEHFRGPVYSLEVPGSQTVAASGGLTLHNCFPKDLKALKQLAGNTGYHFQLLTAVIEVNELQKRRVVQKLNGHLGSLVGKRIALLGLAFKPDTDDMREASSLVLAPRLQGEGAEVVAYDPVAMGAARELLGGVELCDSALAALEGADAAVLVTEWREFAELDWAEAASRMAQPLLIDGRNFLDAKSLISAGFEYEGIGRAVESAPSQAAAD